MKKTAYVYWAIVLIVIITGIFYISFLKKEIRNLDNQTLSGIPDLIVIESPVPEAIIASPLEVKGKARGTWYFEATFPIVLTDWDGKIIAQGYATAKEDWMTEEFVPFTGTLEFTNPSWEAEFSKRGSLIFKKDNPSGLPEYDNSYEMTVWFE